VKKQHGFTLIELMIVFVIIGILAALAIPRYMAWSGESQAKTVLKQIYQGERTYHDKFSTYWIPKKSTEASAENPAAFDTIGVKIPIDIRLYIFTISGDGKYFRATASRITDYITVNGIRKNEGTIDPEGVQLHIRH